MSGFISFITDLLVGGYKFLVNVIDFLAVALQVSLYWNGVDINVIPIFIAFPVILTLLMLKTILKGGK